MCGFFTGPNSVELSEKNWGQITIISEAISPLCLDLYREV